MVAGKEVVRVVSCRPVRLSWHLQCTAVSTLLTTAHFRWGSPQGPCHRQLPCGAQEVPVVELRRRRGPSVQSLHPRPQLCQRPGTLQHFLEKRAVLPQAAAPSRGRRRRLRPAGLSRRAARAAVLVDVSGQHVQDAPLGRLSPPRHPLQSMSCSGHPRWAPESPSSYSASRYELKTICGRFVSLHHY
jgi:hypothetical protein